jgi:hypothetical protein
MLLQKHFILLRARVACLLPMVQNLGRSAEIVPLASKSLSDQGSTPSTVSPFFAIIPISKRHATKWFSRSALKTDPSFDDPHIIGSVEREELF